jgi:YVTN family beta-propeller protein
MKHAILTALLLGAWLSGADAQQSGKAVGPGPGPAPSAQYAWVTNNGGNSVTIRLATSGNAVTVLSGAGFGFSQPFDIVGSPAHKRVFVSNQGAGTVSVIDSDTLKPLGVVALPNGGTARGLSLSEDESAVYVAGATVGANPNPAVWQIDTVTLNAGLAPIATRADPAHIAEDCVVIRSGNAGGSGNGPGKVYFTVQNSSIGTGDGYIGIINVMGNPPFPVSFITTATLALASVNLPTKMERTPDHRFVFVGCSKVQLTTGADLRIIRIDPLTDAAISALVTAVATDSTSNQVFDVSWRATPSGVNRGFILAFDQTGLQIREIDESGLFQAGTQRPANGGGLNAPQTIRFAALTEQVYVGDIPGTFTGYEFYNAKNSPLPAPVATSGIVGGCLNFAVMTAPTPVVTDICPRGALVAASMPVTVHGAGFLPTSTYNGGLPITAFIDSNTIMVDLAGPAATVGLLVDNNNFQTNTIDLFFRRYTPELRPPFTITLPSVSQGYQMLSLPQYATLPALQAAFTAQLGPYNPVLYRVFFYRNGSYVELNGMAPDGCDLAGESFWVLTRNGAMLTLSEPDVRSNGGGTNRVIPINPGFNMISLPTLNLAGVSGAIPWPSVLVSPTPTNFTASAVSVTAAPGILTPVALEYVNGAYATADPLIAGRGYWVENVSSSPAYLIFQPGAVTKPGNVAQAGGAPPPAGMNPPPPPSGMANATSGGSGGCGGLGLDGLLLALALRAVFLRPRGLRKLRA